MKKWPLVSVVIPSYNHEKYIEKCLDSIIDEGYQPIEIIVIDDGSQDKTYDIIKSWHIKKGHLCSGFKLMRQENQGITKTLNRMVSLCTGDYITPLASDDFLLKGGIWARVKYLEKNPKMLAVFGDCLVVDEMDNVLSHSGISEFYERSARKIALQNQKLIAMELALRWTVPGPVFMMRKSTADIVGYYDESLTVEDRDFFLRLLTRRALGFVDFKVACYRWHPGNVVKDPSGDLLRRNALKIASLKSSREAKGLLKIALLIDYYHNRNSISWRVAWRILIEIQTLRIVLSKHA